MPRTPDRDWPARRRGGARGRRSVRFEPGRLGLPRRRARRGRRPRGRLSRCSPSERPRRRVRPSLDRCTVGFAPRPAGCGRNDGRHDRCYAGREYNTDTLTRVRARAPPRPRPAGLSPSAAPRPALPSPRRGRGARASGPGTRRLPVRYPVRSIRRAPAEPRGPHGPDSSVERLQCVLDARAAGPCRCSPRRDHLGRQRPQVLSRNERMVVVMRDGSCSTTALVRPLRVRPARRVSGSSPPGGTDGD